MKPSYRFDPFVLDGRAYRLMRGEMPLELPPKVLDLLFLLAAKPGALLTKEDIFDALWPGVSVTDNAITQVVSDLRQALGDTPASPAFVQTVPRRGYRFIAGVTVVDNGAQNSAAPAAPAGERDVASVPAPLLRTGAAAGPRPRRAGHATRQGNAHGRGDRLPGRCCGPWHRSAARRRHCLRSCPVPAD